MLKSLYIPVTKQDMIQFDNFKDNSTGTKNIQDALINHMLINNAMNFGDEVLFLRMGRNLPNVELLGSLMGSYDFIVDQINKNEKITDEEKESISSAFKKIGFTKIDNSGNINIDDDFIDKYLKFMMTGHKEANMADSWKTYKMSARYYFNKKANNSQNLNDYPDMLYPLSIVSRINREDNRIMNAMCKALTPEEEEETKRRIEIFTTNYEEYLDIIKKLPTTNEVAKSKKDEYEKILSELSNYDHKKFIMEREIKRTWFYKTLYQFIDTLSPENKPLKVEIVGTSNINPLSINEAHLDYTNEGSYRYIYDIIEQLPDSNDTKKQILSQLGLTSEELKKKMEEEKEKKKNVDNVTSKLSNLKV